MRLPSLVKLPKHKQFNYQPRHYDPVKEEFEERVKRIEDEVKAEKGEISFSDGYDSRISQAFRNNRRKSQPAFALSSALMLRLSIISLFVVGGYVWLEYGDRSFTFIGAMVAMFVLYIFMKFRR